MQYVKGSAKEKEQAEREAEREAQRKTGRKAKYDPDAEGALVLQEPADEDE